MNSRTDDLIELMGVHNSTWKMPYQTAVAPMQAIRCYWCKDGSAEVYTVRGDKVYRSTIAAALAARYVFFIIKRQCGTLPAPGPFFKEILF